jgi:thioredoxin 2
MTEPLTVFCPHCHKPNRVPSNRVADRPNCGACKKPLLDGHVAELTDSSLPALTSRSDLPVLVDFWANWCGPCKTMAPEFQSAAKRWVGKVVFAKVDTEQAPQASGRFGIRSIPTLILLRHGKELARKSGAMSAAQLSSWLEQQLG